MEEKKVTAGLVPQCITVGNYHVKSSEEISQEEEYGLVIGAGLTVVNEQSEVLYENVRAFLPISDRAHVIRLNDKTWVLFVLKGERRKERQLKKVNLRIGGKVLMFDERGKWHRNQVSPYYKDIAF